MAETTAQNLDAIGEIARSSEPRSLAQINQVLAAAGQRIAIVAVLAVLLIAVFNVADITLRNVFGLTFYGRNEINALLVAVAVSTCLPIGLARGSVLSIDLLSNMGGARWKLLVLAIVGLVTALFFGLVGYRIIGTASMMAANGQTTVMTEIPKAPFFYVMGSAVGIAALVQLLLAITALSTGFRIWSTWQASAAIVLAAAVAYVALAFLMVVPGDFFMALVPSSTIGFAVLAFAGMWVIILAGVPIGVSMGLTGLAGTVAILGNFPAMSVLGAETTSFITRDSLSVLPLFLLMGAFANLAGIGSDLYKLAHAVVGHVRGGLAHASILACAAFGTLTGSSVATQMSIGKIGLEEMRARGYSTELAAGAIAAGGTLGQLIPPSSALILYGVLTEQSIGRLFIGALLPGLIAALLYMGAVTVWLILYPDHAVKGERPKLKAVFEASKNAWAVILLLIVVLGGIYMGFFTELEAGSVGAVGAFILAVARGKITRDGFWGTLSSTTGTLAMMYSLLFGAIMLTFFFGISGLPRAFVDFMMGLELTPLQIILCLVACYLVLGTAMDAFAMMIITIPIFVPLVESLGYDPIWWGIMTLVCMEAGQISPPFGINMFVIRSLAPDIPMLKVYKGSWPFFASTVVKIALLIAVPALVTWLPSTM